MKSPGSPDIATTLERVRIDALLEEQQRIRHPPKAPPSTPQEGLVGDAPKPRSQFPPSKRPRSKDLEDFAKKLIEPACREGFDVGGAGCSIIRVSQVKEALDRADKSCPDELLEERLADIGKSDPHETISFDSFLNDIVWPIMQEPSG